MLREESLAELSMDPSFVANSLKLILALTGPRPSIFFIINQDSSGLNKSSLIDSSRWFVIVTDLIMSD